MNSSPTPQTLLHQIILTPDFQWQSLFGTEHLNPENFATFPVNYLHILYYLATFLFIPQLEFVTLNYFIEKF